MTPVVEQLGTRTLTASLSGLLGSLVGFGSRHGPKAVTVVQTDTGLVKVTGTSRADRISVSQDPDTGDVTVTAQTANRRGRLVGDPLTWTFHDATGIQVAAGAGNDDITLLGLAQIQAVVNGGGGNDTVSVILADDNYTEL